MRQAIDQFRERLRPFDSGMLFVMEGVADLGKATSMVADRIPDRRELHQLLSKAVKELDLGGSMLEDRQDLDGPCLRLLREFIGTHRALADGLLALIDFDPDETTEV